MRTKALLPLIFCAGALLVLASIAVGLTRALSARGVGYKWVA